MKFSLIFNQCWQKTSDAQEEATRFWWKKTSMGSGGESATALTLTGLSNSLTAVPESLATPSLMSFIAAWPHPRGATRGRSCVS